MSYSKILLLLACLLSAIISFAFTNSPVNLTADCSTENITFQTGESLKYSVYYNWTAFWVKAGKVTFDVEETMMNNEAVYHLVGTGRTLRSYDWAYKVRDRYESFVNPYTMKPIKFVRDIKEGGYKQKNQYSFDHNNVSATVDYRYVQGKLKMENEPLSISTCTQDILSAIYYFRCADQNQLTVNDTIPVEVVIDNEMYNIYMRYLGKDVLDTDLGTFRCVKFSPLLLKGDYFRGGEEMVVWATDDENRLPLFVESPIAVGSVKAYLTDYSGLRNPLTSKID